MRAAQTPEAEREAQGPPQPMRAPQAGPQREDGAVAPAPREVEWMPLAPGDLEPVWANPLAEPPYAMLDEIDEVRRSQ